jgi:hypothetical protein
MEKATNLQGALLVGITRAYNQCATKSLEARSSGLGAKTVQDLCWSFKRLTEKKARTGVQEKVGPSGKGAKPLQLQLGIHRNNLLQYYMYVSLRSLQ